MASSKADCWIFNCGGLGREAPAARASDPSPKFSRVHLMSASDVVRSHAQFSSSPLSSTVKKVALNRKESCHYFHQGFSYHQLSMRCLGRCGVGVGVCTCLFIAFHRGLHVNGRFEVSKQLRKDFHEPTLPPFRLYLFLACQYMTFVYTDQPTFCSWKTV